MHQPSYYSIEACSPNAVYNLSSEIIKIINELDAPFKDVIVLCIGTDRSTGDCLGPLVGYKLTSIYNCKDVHIFGTLDLPVHAKNLYPCIEDIYSTFLNPLVIAVDASLGRSENIGKINLFKGPLYPGSGVNKALKSIGDISITGIVNISGYMEYMVLQNTRLSVVMNMADIIAHSLYRGLHTILSRNNDTTSIGQF
jgi:putative sporulation protein YyaC